MQICTSKKYNSNNKCTLYMPETQKAFGGRRVLLAMSLAAYRRGCLALGTSKHAARPYAACARHADSAI
jgi:hypothetical protein